MSTVTRGPARGAVTKRSGIRPPRSSTSRSLAGLASTAPTVPSSVPAASDTVAPTSSWTHRAPGVVEGLGLEVRSPQGLGGRRSVDALELHDEAARGRTARPDGTRSVAAGASRAPSPRLVERARVSVRPEPWATTTSPRQAVGLGADAGRPCSRSVVDDVDAGLDAVLGAGRGDQGPDGLGRPAPAADHPAHVLGGDVDAEPDARRRRSSVSMTTASGSFDSERAR